MTIVLLRINKAGTEKNTKPAKDVGKFYNQTTEKFLEVYGEIIQAFRTNNVEEYLEYTAKNMRLKEKMHVLDAGCGVAGPAVFFAKQIPNLKLSALSISKVQIEKAKVKISAAGLENSIEAIEGDFHQVSSIFKKGQFDRAYFLESYGHSGDKEKLLHEIWEVLKPGGMVYIKDLFEREVEDEWEQHYIHKICDDINESYQYHIGTLYETLSILRKKGYIVHYVKIPEVKIGDFEHLSISNEFQNLFNIGKIDSWDGYVFPIDFFEILAEKPVQLSEKDRHLYFMNKS